MKARKKPHAKTSVSGQDGGAMGSKALVVQKALTRILDQPVSQRNQQLLKRQKAVLDAIRIARQQPVPSHALENPTTSLSTREIATRVGILTPSGKLAASYKK
jgi:hypothetical protein